MLPGDRSAQAGEIVAGAIGSFWRSVKTRLPRWKCSARIAIACVDRCSDIQSAGNFPTVAGTHAGARASDVSRARTCKHTIRDRLRHVHRARTVVSSSPAAAHTRHTHGPPTVDVIRMGVNRDVR